MPTAMTKFKKNEAGQSRKRKVNVKTVNTRKKRKMHSSLPLIILQSERNAEVHQHANSPQGSFFLLPQKIIWFLPSLMEFMTSTCFSSSAFSLQKQGSKGRNSNEDTFFSSLSLCWFWPILFLFSYRSAQNECFATGCHSEQSQKFPAQSRTIVLLGTWAAPFGYLIQFESLCQSKYSYHLLWVCCI